ncbi:MAG: hypothetical protein V1772_10080 [Chloroflexota bacterium]
MSGSDEIRAHCRSHYIEPAIARGDYSVTIRVGDVHRDLGLRDRMPQVSAALGTDLFEQECHLRRISIDGPVNGSSALFTFLLLDNLSTG